ncbi:MAG: Chemotaxis response regulator protein-glutamate methylesterase [Candidatus Dichloromethanomonas elyunquensis]|nr:MAG: Chemotaxis response regulator protein-glutamate methylesterase [Candidatus Dichloromethanomonas elyunquensis]
MNKPHRPIRVLIVDDSPFIRMSLKKILSGDPHIEVVDTARDGREGILKLQALKPDVVTLDVEMPVMNGIQALEEIMRWQPTPIIVLSAVTTDGTKLTMKALELGAVEVVAKPSGRQGDDLVALSEDIILKVKSVAGVNTSRLGKKENENLIMPSSQNRFSAVTNDKQAAAGQLHNLVKYSGIQGDFPRHKIEIVGIGTSTGGPTALQTVLSKLPKEFPVPVVVAQHMPAGFTASLAARLNSLCQATVKEAEDGEILKAGTVYIGPAGKQFQIKKNQNSFFAYISTDSPISTLYKPSVDVLFMSLAKEIGAGGLGVVMTGMGNDGLNGVKHLKAQGAFAIAESEKTCIVYGMPRSIVDAGLADRIELLPDIGRVIIECVNRR